VRCCADMPDQAVIIAVGRAPLVAVVAASMCL
jgi:hypothetical protein